MFALIRKKEGTTTVEFAMIALVLFIVIFGITDFARLLWQWNSVAKATHWGARYAIVNDVVASGLQNFDCLAAAGGNGVTCPLSAVSPNPVICSSSGCNGYGPLNAAAFTAIVAAMQRINSRITATNVTVEYRHIGLGFAGNPFGADIAPTVTVKLTGMVFNFLTPMLSTITSVNLPDFRTTLTGEDLSS